MENKLVINNAKQCMDILSALMNNSYPPEKSKAAAYIGMDYFVKNLHVFNKIDVENILSNEKLNVSISSRLSYELLENAITNNKVFSSYSKKWFNNVKINQPLLEQYLKILLSSEDNQQIEDFCNANPALSKNYLKNNIVENYTFEKFVIGNNPELITKRRLLSEDDLLELIEKKLLKYEHIKSVFFQYSFNFQTLITKEDINKILKYNVEEPDFEKREEIRKLVSENSLFFIKRIQQLNPEFANKLLLSPGKKSLSFHPETTINFLQTMILDESVRKNNFKELMIIALHDYKDILFQDVKQAIGIVKYPYLKDYFIHLYEDKNYEVLKGLSPFNEELNTIQKDIVLSSCFEELLTGYKNFKGNFPTKDMAFDMAPYIKPLLYFPYDTLFKKVNELKKLENIEESIFLQLEKYILNKKLTENLVDNNSTKEKKLKI